MNRKRSGIVMRKSIIITVLITTWVALMPTPSLAGTDSVEKNLLISNSNYYFETIIENEENNCNSFQERTIAKASSTTKTKSKTTYCKNSSGTVMWYVKVTGTFTYGNGSVKCTKSICTAVSENKTWKISHKTSSKAGNKASGTAKGTHYLNGVPAEAITKIVTLKCNSSGVFS